MRPLASVAVGLIMLFSSTVGILCATGVIDQSDEAFPAGRFVVVIAISPFLLFGLFIFMTGLKPLLPVALSNRITAFVERGYFGTIILVLLLGTGFILGHENPLILVASASGAFIIVAAVIVSWWRRNKRRRS